MAKVFKVNGIAFPYIMQGNWQDNKPVGGLDGLVTVNNYRTHILSTNVQPVAEFAMLYALEGQKVTITTTNFNDRNGDFVTYLTATLKSINGPQVSTNMESIQARFLVLVL